MPRFLLLLALALLLSPAASAQLALGAQLGTPTGISAKFGDGRGAVLLAAGWDLDERSSVSVEGHYLFRENRIDADTDLALFYGPGVFFRAREGADPDLGVSLGVGLALDVTREIELYGLVSPRLQLIEETDFELGGGVGARFTF